MPGENFQIIFTLFSFDCGVSIMMQPLGYFRRSYLVRGAI